MPHLTPAQDAPPPTQTALIVPVPEAEPVVSSHRQRLDAAASWGVPAHVTVLYPFVQPALAADPAVITAIASAVRTVEAFDCTFGRIAWFDEDVLWLAPDPAQPFRDLTRAVHRAFPDHPPYGGAHDGSMPHLTVAERRLGGLPALEQAEQQVTPHLPVRARIDRVLLIAGTQAPMSWRLLHELPLGPAR